MSQMRILATAMAVLLSMAGRLPAKDESAQTAPATKTPAERIAPLVRVIDQARSPSDAIAAYARGFGIDRTHTGLQNAHMRKMLQFGLPKIARYPARVLVTLEKGNGMAWGVVGYMHGKRGELAEALAAHIQAAAFAPDDPSILHNTGQLLAWYDNEIDRPRLSDPIRRMMDRIRNDLFKQQAFARAYLEMKTAYEQRAKLAAELAKRLGEAQDEAEDARGKAADINRKLRDINDEIEERTVMIEGLYRELNVYYYQPYPINNNGTVEYIYVPVQDYGRRAAIYNRIRTEESAISGLRVEFRKVRREGRSILDELDRRRTTLDTLQKQSQAVLARVDRTFRWDPPSVDGKVTAEVGRFIPVPSRRIKLPEEPQFVSEQRLELAKLYLRHGMEDKAIRVLEDLVANNGGTTSGRKAKVLLATLRPGR